MVFVSSTAFFRITTSSFGTARFSAGLSTQSFLKRMSLVHYSAEALSTVAPHVTALGGSEDLLAHVEAVQVRVRAATP